MRLEGSLGLVYYVKEEEEFFIGVRFLLKGLGDFI